MTEIAFDENYRTQEELGRAYRRLGHTSRSTEWSATLLITRGLTLKWVCPVLGPPEPDGIGGEPRPRRGWHVIADAGELDWPPLRPEEEIWPALLERQPVPTDDRAEQQARFLGKTVEEMHRDALRRHFLSDAHIGRIKRNPTDVNFDPAVRDWDASARELADFLDDHRPPKLTEDQRVMVQGVRLHELEAAVAATKVSLGRLMRNAARAARNPETNRLPRGFQADMVTWSGRSRPTVADWLGDGSCCEGAVPTEDGTPRPAHTHTTEEAR